MATTAREVCLLIGKGGAILWSDASDSPHRLPDSRDRWDAIWQNREVLEIIVHSHPHGPHGFSSEDRSTMSAIDGALGKACVYAVVSPRGTIQRQAEEESDVSPEPWWASLLRLASGMVPEAEVVIARAPTRKET